MEDLTLESYTEISKKAGGLIIQLPQNFNNLSVDTSQRIYQIEQSMLSTSVKIPIYFSHNEKLDHIINDINLMATGDSKSNSKSSALNDLLLRISSNGYQAITTGSDHTPNKKSKLPIIQGELVPSKKTKNTDSNSRLSTIVITASISPFGVSNHISSFNPDAALLMIIIDFFSKIYSNQKTTPNYKIIFLLSESGSLLNFQGTKKWLDDNQVQVII